jgi:5-methylcytosine-specific restriction endonuclease McrA
MSRLTSSQKRRILDLRVRGLSQSAIGAEVGCSQGTVSRVLASSTPGGATRLRELERQYRRANARKAEGRRRANAASKAEYDRKYRRANAERLRECQRKYRVANKKKIRARDHHYRELNGDQIRKRKRMRWMDTAEMINARRRENYDDGARDRARGYRLANIEASRATLARRKVRGRVGMDATDRLLSVEYRKAIAYDSCAYCGAVGEHDDHKLPLRRGGTDHWWNLHRACRDCNFRKHTMTHEEFLAVRRIGRPS